VTLIFVAQEEVNENEYQFVVAKVKKRNSEDQVVARSHGEG
jgi:hypothetical protein